MALRRDHCKPENRLPPAVGHMQIGIFKHIVGNRTVVGNHAVNQADRLPVLKRIRKQSGKTARRFSKLSRVAISASGKLCASMLARMSTSLGVAARRVNKAAPHKYVNVPTGSTAAA